MHLSLVTPPHSGPVNGLFCKYHYLGFCMRLVVQCLQAASPAEWKTLEEMEIYNITIEYLKSATYASV